GSSKLGLSYQDIFDKFRIWKLIKSNFATSESLRYRLVQISTRALCSLCLKSRQSPMYLGMIKTHNDLLLVSNSVLLYPSLSHYTTANLLTSGPYALVFAYFVPFYLDIPVSKRFNVFGAHFSDKSFIYLVGVQVNNTIKSFTIFLEKIHVTWYLWHNCWFLVSVEHLLIPGFMASLFSRMSLPSLSSHSQAPRRTSPSLGRQARSYQAPLPSSIEPSEEAIVVFVRCIACIYDLLLSFMYLLTKHKNKIATPVNLKPRRASCHFTTCVRRRGKEGVFSGFQDSRPSVQESSHYYIRLTHVLLNGPKRRKTYYAVCVFYNYVLLCMVLL
ncbi:hypothetical protein HID58_058160, partial [Brassica napus]